MGEPDVRDSDATTQRHKIAKRHVFPSRHGALGLGAVAAVALLWPRAALAHEVGLSRGDFAAADGAAVRADVAFARRDFAGLVAGLDADGDGAVTQAEIDAGRDSIQGAIVSRIKITGDGAPCVGELVRVELAEQDGVSVRALYRCPHRPQRASITLAFMADLPFGHRHLARAFAAKGELDLVLSQRAPTFSFALPPDPDAGRAPPADTSAPALIRRGALHVATAWPLPVFLLGLVARCASRRAAIAASAAFAAALLAGLAVSALDLFTPSPRAAFAAAAASLAYVGIDNFAGGDREPWIAFPFGVVHGFACATAFRAPFAPPSALAAFTVGALAALAVVVALLVAASPWVRSRPRGVMALSAAVAAAGIVGVGLALH